MSKPSANMNLGLRVNYKTMIVNPDGSIAKENPWTHNLILDSGMDQVGIDRFVDCFEYAVVGTGTTATNRDSSTTEASQTASDAVVADANFFDANDVGRLLKYDSGEEYYITAFTDPQNVTVDTSATVASTPFTIYYVNEVQHGTESKRTNSYVTDSGDNSSVLVGNTITFKRTFIFSAEVGAVTYREIGWSWGATGATELFGRDLISGGGDSLGIDQRYKVVLEVSLDFTPNGSTAVSDVGDVGFNTAGNATMARVLGTEGFCGIAATGAASFIGAGSAEPTLIGGQANQLALILEDFTLPTGPTSSGAGLPTVGDGASTYSLQTYTSGNFYRDAIYTFDLNDGNGTVYGMRCSLFYYLKFTSTQTKDSDHELVATMRVSWSRTLTN